MRAMTKKDSPTAIPYCPVMCREVIVIFKRSDNQCERVRMVCSKGTQILIVNLMRHLLIILSVIVSFAAIGQEANNHSRPYALVAGGSKGIGFAIAEALAKRQYNLVLVARNIEALENAEEKLESKYGVNVEVLSFDLSKKESAPEIARWCIERELPLKMLCNVAGHGGSEDYLSAPLDTMEYMVDLNIESGLTMVQLLLPLLEKNAPSYIMNVGSMAGYAPIPDKNVYAATKAAVIFFSYGLRYQLKEKQISVSCLNPGPVFTKQSIREDTERRLGWFGRKMAVSPVKVGEKAVKKTLRGKLMITPGVLASVSAVAIRTLPRRWVTAFYYQAGKKTRKEKQATESVRK